MAHIKKHNFIAMVYVLNNSLDDVKASDNGANFLIIAWQTIDKISK